MGLPLYLAMNAAEIAASVKFPPLAWMSCHFSPCSQGLTNLPLWLPEGSLAILDDAFPCQGHDAALAVAQLAELTGCAGAVLDFQRPGEKEIPDMIATLLRAFPCPMAVSDLYAPPFQCPVFLRPGSLWEPLEEHLKPWQGREVWLDVSLCQQQVVVTASGVDPGPILAWDRISDGFYDETLRCHYRTEVTREAVTFTFFDTPESMRKKLELAQALGVCRAIGLWRELGSCSSQ